MHRPSIALRILFLLALALAASLPAVATHAAGTPYATRNAGWRAASGDFSSWTRSGVTLGSGGVLQLDPGTAVPGTDPYPPGGYNGHNFYNGGGFLVGEATSPVTEPGLSFTQAIASWNAGTPPGSWVETLLSVRIGSRWTKWYNMGIWAADSSAVERHSVNLQGDADGFVAVDTLILGKKKGSVANAYRLKLRLFSTGGAIPTVSNASVAVSTTPVEPGTLEAGNPALWNRVLAVPECSQMVYPDGGEVWCSPTSVSMVLGYWSGVNGPCEPRVRAAVAGVYDWLYDGHGNWPFNTAYAAAQGYESFVARFTSLSQAESWIAAGVPVVISFAWGKSDLAGAAIPSSSGHLAVLVGFDAAGNPIVNDPAAASNEAVQRTYLRSELESLWLEHSGGTVYLIYPAGRAVPGL